MDTQNFYEYGKLLFKIANFIIISKFVFKRSKFFGFLIQFLTLFWLLIRKFIQIQLLPISFSFILNESLSSYNNYYSDKYCELFRKLGREFTVQYDRSKNWKANEIRDLVNEVYSVYAALYISLNIYKTNLSLEGLNFYNHLRNLVVLFSNVDISPSNIDYKNLANIEIYSDVVNSGQDSTDKDIHGKLTRDLAPGNVSFLSLLHSENAWYVNDHNITQVLNEYHDFNFYEKVVSHCNTLYNVASVLKREGYKEHSRGWLSHILSKPNYIFGNLDFMRCLMMYKYKGVHIIVHVDDLRPGVIDALFIPDRNMIAHLELNRSKIDVPITSNSESRYLLSLLYGSDVYLRVLENYRSSRRIVINANPNGVCYEFNAMDASDINLHVDNGRAFLLFNYPSVGYSKGKPEIKEMTRKCNHLIKYINEQFTTSPKTMLGMHLETYDFKLPESRKSLAISFHGTSLGGLFILKMIRHMEGSNDNEFMIFHKTVGDMKRLSMHFVSNLVGPFLRFFNLDQNCAEDFVKVDADKVVIVDVNDEIIPLGCSLAHSVARTHQVAGVGKLSNSFMDYKYRTLQLLSEQINSAASFGSMSSISSTSSHDKVAVRIKLVKDILSLLGKDINSTGQTLLNLLEKESRVPLKEDVVKTSEYFTRMAIYGSMPLNCMPKAKVTEKTLSNMYNVLERLGLNANYFSLYKSRSGNRDTTSTCGGSISTAIGANSTANGVNTFSTFDSGNAENGGSSNNSGNGCLDSENVGLVKIPPKVAVYLSVLLDEVDVYGRVESVYRSTDSDVGSINSNNSDGGYYKKRVIFKEGDYYMDFKSIGTKRLVTQHLVEQIKNDLRNFGLSASRYKLLPVKLLSYMKLYSLFNALNSLALINELFSKHNYPMTQRYVSGEEKDDVYDVYTLAKNFVFNLVQVLIEEPFKEGEDASDGTRDNKKLFGDHMERLKQEYKRFGVTIPQFVGHCFANSHLDNSLLNYLVRNI